MIHIFYSNLKTEGRWIVPTSKSLATDGLLKSHIAILIISFCILGFEMCSWFSQWSGKKITELIFPFLLFGYVFIL